MIFKRKEKNSGPIDWIIAGLGNPGKKYVGTRHNAGFIVMEMLANKLEVDIKKIKFKSYCEQVKIGDQRVLLMMPQTFMNLSGDALYEAMSFYKIPPENTLIILDDVSFEPGNIRIRRKGSDGGQNGMKNIILRGGSDSFPRIKIGIGTKPHPDYDMADWVLSKFTEKDKKALVTACENACEAALLIVDGKIDEAMNKFSK